VFAHLGKVLKATLLAVALLAFAVPAQASWYGGWHGGWHGGYGYGYRGYYPGYYGYYPRYYGSYYGGYYPRYYGYGGYSYYPSYSYPYTTYYSWAPYYYYPSGTYYPYASSAPVTTSTSAYLAPDGATVSAANYGERLNDKRAHLRVQVPANAKVWLNGQAMRQRGRERDFYSPVLKSGKKYEYEVRARWKENGKTVDETKKVDVRPNAWSEVDFTR
jgi:uncharacterized protein (TIGR03000 family)